MTFEITIKPSDHAFPCEAGETVLASAMRADLMLPYGCRNGACGTCKGKIVAGEVDYGQHQKSTLTEDEKRIGYALFCVARPLTDVTIEVRPLSRGSGFQFQSRIVGGAVPRQWIPAVEMGVRDGLQKGPLGFPVTDLEVTLTDGMTHSVDSSEMAFRTAGRLAIEEALKALSTTLLEPIEKLTVYSPSPSASNVTSALTARRGQILGLGPREDWQGWERIDAYLPQSERQDLIAELRGLTQGLGAFEADFDHMAELTGRLAAAASQGARAGA